MAINRYDKTQWRGALAAKIKTLSAFIKEHESALVAFSGGADSAFLAAMTVQILGNRALAVTEDSPLLPRKELMEAVKLAKKLGIRHLVIKTACMRNKSFTSNAPDRCYHCKKSLFSSLLKIARKEHIACVMDGSNIDDKSDYRPGSRAAVEKGVKSPLQSCGFTKKDIRLASRKLGLPTADKPATACLASRLPYGTGITKSKLSTIEQTEDKLHKLGFRQCRVRLHGNTARIELSPEDMAKAVNRRVSIINYFQKHGIHNITLDLRGYRTGSMNIDISKSGKESSP